MMVSTYNEEAISVDLKEYISAIKLTEIKFDLLSKQDDSDTKKIIVEDIQNLIYPNFFNEDQITLSINFGENKAVFIHTCEATDGKLKEFETKLSNISDLVMNRNKFSLFNISKDKAKQKITNDLNVKTLCISLNQKDPESLILNLYCTLENQENNRNRVIQVFSKYILNEKTIKLSIESFNKDIFKSVLNDEEVTVGIKEKYHIFKMRLSKNKNKNEEKEYFLNISILPNKLDKFKNDKSEVEFSFNNLKARYHDQLNKN